MSSGGTQSRAAESLLEPLFRKLSAFATLSSVKSRNGAVSKSSDDILLFIDQFIGAVEGCSESLSQKFPSLALELDTLLSEFVDAGKLLHAATYAFTTDPMSGKKTDEVYRTGNALLLALSRLLILSEVAEGHSLEQLLQVLQENLEDVLSAPNSRGLSSAWKPFEDHSSQLIRILDKRLPDLLNPEHQDQYTRARYMLNNNRDLVLTSNRVYLRHPDHVGAQIAKDFASRSMIDAIDLIRSTLNPDQKPGVIRLKVSGKLLDEIEGFENSTLIDVKQFDDKRIRANMERQLKRLLPSVYQLADSNQTHPSRRSAIYSQCKKLRATLESLLREYNTKPTNQTFLNEAMENLLTVTGGLKQLVTRTAVEHAAETFMNKNQPLMSLSDATKFGNDKSMENAAQSFQDHSAAMVSAAYEIFSVTSNEKVAESAQMYCSQLEQLCPQVINAAYLNFKYPYSRSAEANLEAFKDAYQNSAHLLNSNINKLTNMHDFLAVSDDQMLLDYENSLRALSERNESMVDQTSTAMQHRSSHMCEAVILKMADEKNNPEYVDHVMEKVTLLRDEYTPAFTMVARDTLSRLTANQPVDERKFRQSGKNLCTAVHGVRVAALNETDLPSELEALRSRTPVEPAESPSRRRRISDPWTDTGRAPNSAHASDSFFPDGYRSPSGSLPRDAHVFAQENRQSERTELYAMLTEPERETMAQELAGFLEEKKRLLREVVKWDDSANEIIVLAKKMCLIMMEMTDFTRGKGPLNSTMEVIEAAREISKLGQRLDRLCRDIADLCPDSASRRDLLAYLQRVTLHCHQLNITSRVKAGVQAARAEVVENSTALIQAATNLMTAVVLTVKESYIASTKYLGPNRRPIVHWRMRAPAKKPLVSSALDREHDGDSSAEWEWRGVAPPMTRSDALSELSQFDNMPPPQP
ncbi:unnamed protein product [Calicophoron daubneyi]|uniref:Uncharacterized protein n=1 Tax=Calicophoron daubneyi TaxID=300641 RepID=A0AAV2TSE3_CALDB